MLFQLKNVGIVLKFIYFPGNFGYVRELKIYNPQNILLRELRLSKENENKYENKKKILLIC